MPSHQRGGRQLAGGSAAGFEPDPRPAGAGWGRLIPRSPPGGDSSPTIRAAGRGNCVQKWDWAHAPPREAQAVASGIAVISELFRGGWRRQTAGYGVSWRREPTSGTVAIPSKEYGDGGDRASRCRKKPVAGRSPARPFMCPRASAGHTLVDPTEAVKPRAKLPSACQTAARYPLPVWGVGVSAERGCCVATLGQQRNPVSSKSKRRHGWPSCLGRTMPSCFIRPRSVLGWRPRIFAAPCGPSMTQPDLSRAARMWFRVLDCRLSSGGVGPASAAVGLALSEPDGVGGPAFAARAAAANTSGSISSAGPLDRMTARSRTFSSSRMFPGQE